MRPTNCLGRCSVTSLWGHPRTDAVCARP